MIQHRHPHEIIPFDDKDCPVCASYDARQMAEVDHLKQAALEDVLPELLDEVER